MTNQDVRNFTVKWSSKLEELADGLLQSWQSGVLSPFQKTCIVVHDNGTENWLKQYFLLDKRIPQVLMGIDFVRLPQFLNDWLAAAVQEVDPRFREAGSHPYSRERLTWRIYKILTSPRKSQPELFAEFQAEKEDELQELLDYTKDRSGKFNFLKCYNLSAKLAALYDDYLNSRGQMLRNWEKGKNANREDIPRWQVSLYQQLVKENSHTYATDFEKAFSDSLDAKVAFEHGFPKYRRIHVFDIPFMSEPELHLLEKISQATPMTFWIFNPQWDWLGETESKSEVAKRLRKMYADAWSKQRSALQQGWLENSGDSIGIQDADDLTSSDRMLGALASGARAMVQHLCEDTDGDIDVVGTNGAMEELGQRDIQVHSNYSPRRELEAIKDGLLDFFAKHSEAKPHEAIVLCGDWESYVPIIESVFSAQSGTKGYIPVKVAGGVLGESPFCQSLRDLLAFRTNRFEVSAVFNLLKVPAIQQKFKLGGNAVDSLANMVKEANIHWGYDDSDVWRILEIGEKEERTYRFTWQHGMDRMVAEMFHGFRENEYTQVNAGGLGDLPPCGEVEGDRAAWLAELWEFIHALYQIRQDLAPEKEYSPEALRDKLQGVIRDFYDGTVCQEAQTTMRGISEIAEQMTSAGIDQVGVEVFLAALDGVLASKMPGMRPVGDAVLFAPLNCAVATPHKLVWVCGLNDGKFPKIERRASYDIIGRHPSFFDVSAREKDAFALLKAVLSSRECLRLSYVGKDNHTNEKIPPSVLLNDLKDFFDEEGIRYASYDHPMNAYSARYFTDPPKEKDQLPPTYSSQNEEIARTLRSQKISEASRAFALGEGYIPFPLSNENVTEIQLEDLAAFFSGPNKYLFQDHGISVTRNYDQLCDRENLSGEEVKLPRSLQRNLELIEIHPEQFDDIARMQVETGAAADVQAIRGKMEDIKSKTEKAKLIKTNEFSFKIQYSPLVDKCKEFESAEKKEAVVSLRIGECGVEIHLQYAYVEMEEKTGKHKFMIFHDFYPKENSTLNGLLLLHLGVNAVESGIHTIVFSSSARTVFSALPQDDAKARLADLVALANGPLPDGYPDFQKTSPKEDVLPEEWQKKLSDIVETIKK